MSEYTSFSAVFILRLNVFLWLYDYRQWLHFYCMLHSSYTLLLSSSVVIGAITQSLLNSYASQISLMHEYKWDMIHWAIYDCAAQGTPALGPICTEPVILSELQCRRLPNEVLLIRIRVNDYLIISFLSGAASSTPLCLVNVQYCNLCCTSQCEPFCGGSIYRGMPV